jgi:uncharacterized protein
MTTDRFRVNARFDHVAEEQVRYIVEHTGMSVSDVLKQSVAELYERLRREHRTPFEIMQEMGVIGAYRGSDPDGSTKVKEVVAEVLTRKFGYWIALLDQNDRFHKRAVEASRILMEQLVVTLPVITETTWVLGKRLGTAAAQDMLRLGEVGAYRIHALREQDLPLLRGLMEKYADLPMDLADASLVLLAEQSGDGRILSTDQRDFRAYRFKQHQPFRNLLLD